MTHLDRHALLDFAPLGLAFSESSSRRARARWSPGESFGRGVLPRAIFPFTAQQAIGKVRQRRFFTSQMPNVLKETLGGLNGWREKRGQAT